MKRLIVSIVALATLASASAESWVPREGEIKFKVLQSTKHKTIHEVRNTPFTHHYYSHFNPIDLDTAKPSRIGAR